MEVAFEGVVETGPLILVSVDEPRAAIGDHLYDRHRCVEFLTDAIEEVDALAGRTGVRLGHVEDAPGGVVFDGQDLLSLLVVVPVHVYSDASVRSLEPNPRPAAALFVRIVSHVISFLENSVDAGVGDRDVVSGPQNVSNRDCPSVSALVQSKHPVFEIVRILCVGLASRSVQLWNLAVVATLWRVVAPGDD